MCLALGEGGMDCRVPVGDEPLNTKVASPQVREAALITILATMGCYTSVLWVFRDELQRYLHVNDQGYGLLISVGLVSSALSGVAAGVLIERRGIERVLRVSFGGLAIGMFAVAASTTWGTMVLAVALVSAFLGSTSLAVQAYLVDCFPDNRRRAISINLTVVAAGAVLLPLFAELLLKLPKMAPGVTFSGVLHVPFAVVGVLMLFGTRLRLRERVERVAEVADPAAANARGARMRPGVLLLLVLLAAHGGADNSLAVWSARVLGSASFPVQSVPPGVILSAQALAYLLSRSMLALLPERFDDRPLMIIPALLGGSLCIAGLLSRSQLVLGIALVAGAFLWSFEFPVFAARIAHATGSAFGKMQAAGLLGAGMLGFALANVMGLLGSRLGDEKLWLILLLPAAVFLATGVLGAVWVVRYGRAADTAL